MIDIKTVISHAQTIAKSRHEDIKDVPGVCSIPGAAPDDVEMIVGETLNKAMQGRVNDIYANLSKRWIIVEDMQAAIAFLDKAEKAENNRQTFAASDYRAAANRKLAEAVSWLF